MGEIKQFTLRGTYVSGWQSASGLWQQDILAKQAVDFPEIHEMFPGTFNIRLDPPVEYVPPDVAQLRALKAQSCISKVARVVAINQQSLEAYIYDGGWPANTLELLSREHLSNKLALNIGDPVVIEVQESLDC